MATDPVCGMYVDERLADLTLVRENRTYFFCSTGCLRQFAEPERELARLRHRLAVAWPLSLAVVLLTYVVRFPGGPWVAFGLAGVVQFYPGLSFYQGTRDAIRNRIWNMDVLIAVGTSVAFGYSAATLFDTALPVARYFDASALIITLILTGNYLEHLVRERAHGSLRKLHEVLPSVATVVRDGYEQELPVAEVRPGDRLRVRPGGRFPADGTVVEGRSSVSEALVTGESLPVAKAPGDPVIAGTVNGEGLVSVRATRVGTDTFLAQVGQLVTEAETSHVPLQRLADRIASIFVPVVLVLATGTAVGWFELGGAGWTIALLAFVSVAITACPCAFGIATPAAIVVGTGRAADEGVLFKGHASIEQASRIDTVVSDKTGTLTRGVPSLTDLVPADGWDEAHLLALAAGIEAGSEHPLARAVLEAARARGIAPAGVQDVRADPGRGAWGVWNGEPVGVTGGTSGGPDGVDLGSLAGSAEDLARQGKAWSVVLRGSRPAGLLGFFDDVAPGAPEAVRALQADGIEVVMATGDHERAARLVAERVGIREVHSRMSPGDKLRLIEELQSHGRRVAYVGDGINDAPALARADLGIAIGAGTEVAREAGGVILLRSDFRGVALALRIGRRTVRKVRGNLTWAVGYNSVLLPVAMGALVPVVGLGVFQVLPFVGALAMAISSTLVVLNSYSLRWVSVGEGSKASGRVPFSP